MYSNLWRKSQPGQLFVLANCVPIGEKEIMREVEIVFHCTKGPGQTDFLVMNAVLHTHCLPRDTQARCLLTKIS